MDANMNIVPNAERRCKIMRSREDETYITLNEYNCYNDLKDLELYEIAISLGRIADMLAEMNRYVVNYDDRKKEVLCENQTEVNNET